jgi:hypothetical protein
MVVRVADPIETSAFERVGKALTNGATAVACRNLRREIDITSLH